jgi:hypothetical protein
VRPEKIKPEGPRVAGESDRRCGLTVDAGAPAGDVGPLLELLLRLAQPGVRAEAPPASKASANGHAQAAAPS